jgi:hypothetical protein
MVAYAKMISLRLDIRVDDLIVKKLRRVRPARDLPFIKIQQSPKEAELPLLVQNLDLHKVPELPGERLDSLLKSRKIGLYLRPQQGLHIVVSELRPQFANRPGGIAKETRERCANAGLRPRSFKDDAVEDFDLIEMVPLGFKELSPLVNGGFHYGVLIRSERDLWPVVFEEILVNVEAGAKCLQCGFQAFDGVLLLRVVKALIVHTGDAQQHPKITGLRKERRLVPESIEVDVVVERRTLFPRLDSPVEAKH